MAKQLIKEAFRMQQLAGLINENYVDLGAINSPFMEAKEDDDMDDFESDEEEPDYFSNKPGKKDEFDTDDDIEPAAKDVTAGDDLAKLTGGKQAKLNALTKIKDELFAKWKNKELSTDEYVQKLTKHKTKDGKEINIQQQIKNLQADIDRDLSIDDEEEI